MDLLSSVAAAVLKRVNAGEYEYSPEITADLSYLPDIELPELASLHVTVVPKSRDLAAADRHRDRNEIAIDIAVRQRVEPAAAGQVQALMRLAEQILERLNRANLTVGAPGAPGGEHTAQWLRGEQTLPFSVEKLRTERLFLCVVTVTYLVFAPGTGAAGGGGG